jgi:hypothetical protein
MTPGLGFFYGGLIDQKNVTHTLFLSYICMVRASASLHLNTHAPILPFQLIMFDACIGSHNSAMGIGRLLIRVCKGNIGFW